MKLQESMSGKPMAFMFIKNISETLKFRYGKNKLVTPEICFLSHLLTMPTKLGTQILPKNQKRKTNYEKQMHTVVSDQIKRIIYPLQSLD